MERVLLVLVLCVAVAISASAEQKLSYVDLVNRLTDLEGLATLPVPGETCAQWSSYDRASRYDAASGKYIAWEANADGTGIIRAEGESAVIAEMEGPGCIWRIWSARPDAGHVKIYLDGAPEPAVDLPFIGYFSRENASFTYPSLVHTAASGQNCYVPIPYQKSCKIVAEKGWGVYYHITYGTFPKGAIVPTFKRDLTAEERAALEAADDFLSNRLGADPAGKRTGEVTETKTVSLLAGRTVKLAEITGEGAITALKVRMTPQAPKDAADALREIVLRIFWDGEKTPSVWVPLGDFFGTAPGINKYKSLPLGMTDDGFYCYWYMPFAQGARVELKNEGKSNRSVEVSITRAPLSRPVAQLARFHAKWHRDAFLPEERDRKIDWTILKTEGAGRYCGVVLNVWNPRGGWWGEGDEKFFVDGEKFPSTFGTGSEDYFGYAWGSPQLFQNAYHNQTISMNNRGHISVNRWHITDNVPFQKSFEGAIEKYFPNKRPTLYDCTAYWYLGSDGTDPYEAVPLQDRTGYYTRPKPAKVKGAVEGEALEILEKTSGKTQKQEVSRFGDVWSGDAQLWWTGVKAGDKLVVAVPVKTAGKYRIKACVMKTPASPTVQFLLDGENLGAPIDLYNPTIAQPGSMSLGTRNLKKGLHKLTIEIKGANSSALKQLMFALDYVKLEAVN